MFFIEYAFKGQVHVFAGRVKIVSHSSCRTSVILKYFCPLHMSHFSFQLSCIGQDIEELPQRLIDDYSKVTRRLDLSFNRIRSVLIDFSFTVKAAALIFISGRGSAISSAKQGKSGSIYNLVKN